VPERTIRLLTLPDIAKQWATPQTADAAVHAMVRRLRREELLWLQPADVDLATRLLLVREKHVDGEAVVAQDAQAPDPPHRVCAAPAVYGARRPTVAKQPVVLPRPGRVPLGLGQLLTAAGGPKCFRRPGMDVLGLPPHVGESTGAARRVSVQVFEVHGQKPGDLPLLRGSAPDEIVTP
jgi:hypothetical protein